MLIDFCHANDLYITNTLFMQNMPNRCWTWESPGGAVRSQIDFILVSSYGRGSIKNSRAYPSADIGSDHQLLLANLKLKLGSNRGAYKIQKIDTAKLRNRTMKHAYAN